MNRHHRRNWLKATALGLIGLGAGTAVAKYGGFFPFARYRLVDFAGGKLLDNPQDIFGPWQEAGQNHLGHRIQKRFGSATIQEADAQPAMRPNTSEQVMVWGEVTLEETLITTNHDTSISFQTVHFTPNTQIIEQ